MIEEYDRVQYWLERVPSNNEVKNVILSFFNVSTLKIEILNETIPSASIMDGPSNLDVYVVIAKMEKGFPGYLAVTSHISQFNEEKNHLFGSLIAKSLQCRTFLVHPDEGSDFEYIALPNGEIKKVILNAELDSDGFFDIERILEE